MFFATYLQSAFNPFPDIMFPIKERKDLCDHPTDVPAHHSRAVDDSVWVEHWDDFKDKGLPETLGHQLIAAQKLQGTLHYPASIGLPRMYTAGQYNIGAIT